MSSSLLPEPPLLLADLVTLDDELLPCVLPELVELLEAYELLFKALDRALGHFLGIGGLLQCLPEALPECCIQITVGQAPTELTPECVFCLHGSNPGCPAPHGLHLAGRVPATSSAAVVKTNRAASTAFGRLPVHLASAAPADEHSRQRVAVSGPCRARPSPVSQPDGTASIPCGLVDQGRVLGWQQLAVDLNLPQIGRVLQHVLEHAIGEDHRGGAVVASMRFVLTARWLDRHPVEVIGQSAKAELSARKELEDLPNNRTGMRILDEGAVLSPVTCRDDAQQHTAALQEPQVVPHPLCDLLTLLLRHDCLDLPGEAVGSTDDAVRIEHQDLPFGHVGHETEEFEIVPVKAVLVIEGDRTDEAGWRRPDSGHQRLVAGATGGLFPRPVRVLEVLKRQALKFRTPADRVELLV